LLIELGTKALPTATAALRGFSEVLSIFGGGHKTKEDKTFKPNWMEHLHDLMPWSGPSSLPKTIEPRKQSFLEGPPKGEQAAKPISLTLNIDGRTLARVVSEKQEALYRYETNPTDFNGSGRFA
jgi:hypothetical protein